MSALARALEAAGVRCVFGIPGTQNVGLFEALRRSRVRTVLTGSELGAAFMAGGYARAGGDVGVVITIAGPGFMYALPGIAEAWADSIPLVHITGLPASEPGRQFQLQSIDQAAIAAPIVKAVISVSDPAQVGVAIAEAIAVAQAGEPGPVLLQISDAVADADARGPRAAAAQRPADHSLDEALRLFGDAAQPILLVGQGVAGAAAALMQVAQARRVPVVTTPSGRGVIPEDHELSLGFDPLRNDVSELNALIQRSDLVLALGCKLAHNGSAGFALALPPDRLVHLDPGPHVPGANYPTRLSVCATAEQFLAAVLATPIRSSRWSNVELAEWRARVRAPHASGLPEPDVGAEGKTAAEFFAGLRRSLPREAHLVTDSGMHQVLARRYFDVFSPRGLLFPSDFQSMGFGVPAAIGAALASPGRPVVGVVGDGGVRMTGMELTTAVREGLPVVLFVFSDGKLNQIRVQQLGEYGRPHAVDLGPLDLELFAAASGAAYVRLEGDPGDILAASLARRGPTLVEVPVMDSRAVQAAQVSGRVREGMRRTLGPQVLSWLKRWR